MSHQRWHFIEKIQVEIAAAAGFAVMYFLLWPTIKPWDVDGAVVFLPIGAGYNLLAFAGVVWLLAAMCAALTISARPEGALLATLIGVGGASVHSNPMRLLLMRFEQDLGDLLSPLVWELAAMAGIIIVALLVIHIVRAAARTVVPKWMHRQIDRSGKPRKLDIDTANMTLLDWIPGVRLMRHGPISLAMIKNAAAKGATRSLSGFGLTLLLGLALLHITAFSTDRGQVLFSLAISFFIAAGLANSFFPAGFSAPCWLAPLVLGAAFYLRSSGIAPTGQLTWTQADCFTHALPIDWLAAGCGGAIGGYWLSCRLHDLRHMPEEGKQGEVDNKSE